jgi:hypothetical protein
MLDNIRFFFYTNESGFALGELCVKQFFKHNKREDLKVSLVSNKIPDVELQFPNKVKYLNGNTNYKENGYHFAQTMLNVLSEINEKYIFFFCDDYFHIKETKYDDLEKVLQMMDCDDVDFYGLDDIGADHVVTNYKKYESECNIDYRDNLYVRDNTYRHLFSVQACIWKKEALLNLLQEYNNISLHNLDDTLLSIRENNKLKSICNNLYSCFNYIDIEKNNYYLVAYYEITRHGVFLIPENGQSLLKQTPSVQFIYNLIKEEGLYYKPEFKKPIFFYENED